MRKLVLGLGLILIASLTSISGEGKEYFPSFEDEHTVALWLFDGPQYPDLNRGSSVKGLDWEQSGWYYERTLLDASLYGHDLQFLDGGDTVSGRFGNCLKIKGEEISSAMGLAANYASIHRLAAVFLGGNVDTKRGTEENCFGYTKSPARLLSTFNGNEWTWEFWIKFDSSPRSEAAIVDMGQGYETSFYCSLKPAAESFSLNLPGVGINTECSTDLKKVTDGSWHHLVFQKDSGKSPISHFVDGSHFSDSAIVKIKPLNSPADLEPGLMVKYFSAGNFEQPEGMKVLSALDSTWNEGKPKEWSARIRGYIKAPYTGEVCFSTDENLGLHLDIDNQPIIYGWLDRAAYYRRTPRHGRIKMVAGEVYPLRMEFSFSEDIPGDVPQNLYWSWKGQEKALVPPQVLWHSQKDSADTEKDNGGRDLEERMRYRFNLTLGSERNGRKALCGQFDEMRVSDVVRYKFNNYVPSTHSFTQGSCNAVKSIPTGEPLLFGAGRTDYPINIGSRKHVFIDDALVDTMSALEFRVNPPKGPRKINNDNHGDICFYDDNGEIHMITPGGYEKQDGLIRQWTSKDGINFNAPILGVVEWEGTRENNILMKDVPCWGRCDIDPNPNALPEAKYKMTAYVPLRGVCLYISPDGIHWRRGENILSLVDSGGGSEWFWDDQRGVYKYLLKWDHSPEGRTAVEAETCNMLKTFELNVPKPDSDGLMTPFGEMPQRLTPNKYGQVYRTRARKYSWAPDTYVAFVWRLDKKADFRQTSLSVSRDGINWIDYEGQWYMPAGGQFMKKQIIEALSLDGLVRRGDELWQYADYRTTTHGGAGGETLRVRLTQRLDGFVALVAGTEVAQLTTVPLAFKGTNLKLNVDCDGIFKVGMVDENGKDIKDLGVSDCDPIKTDSTEYTVTWKGQADVSKMSGKTVRLKFEMQNAKLYAMQFD